ncbi:MCE family protein [Antrihabitans cavernicola]|uniref:MCE family protein n=1 Tax=Antrihabitans cavernicola TaxID=2495913 RepID=A0A5A7S7R3_9NOCA|nr:MCE family protein [Spelaeibacter cavernicola]KAA0020208.1 MCE family protein [Spelaeibacter cavernicola]
MSDETQTTATPKKGSRFGKGLLALIAAGLVGVLVLAGVLWWVFTRAGTTDISANFDRSVGIYKGTDVRVLGVKVGTVTSVEPQGDTVKVGMRVKSGVDIPADAKAVQVTPSLVSDRYVQLAPAYTKGPKMESGTLIPRDRTATPVEVDQLYASIDSLSAALGPNGANKDGALDDLVGTLGKNLDGNGAALGNTITELTGAARTLTSYRGDLFDTIKNLQVFVSALAKNDQQVREFNGQLSSLTGFLAGERQNLGDALNQLSYTLGDVAKFVHDNKDLVASNAEGLVQTTQTLANNRQDLADSLTVLPLALSNVVNAYDAESGTLASRIDLPETQDPFGTFCKLLDFSKLVPGDARFEALGRQLRPLLDNCKTVTDQITAGIKTPSLVLPFGILSGDNIQRPPVDGTQSGNISPRIGDLKAPGIAEQNNVGGGR